jgi:hypothetical protein
MSSSLSSVLVARICSCDGNRPSHSVRKSWSGTVVPTNVRRWHRNCDGFLSPSSSRSRSCLVRCSCESVRRWMRAFLTASYFPFAGGEVIIFLISRAYFVSICEITYAYLMESCVIPPSRNCPSSCANHRSGSSGQKGGMRTAIRPTCVVFSSLVEARPFSIFSVRGH